jgi:hypothetical protein
MQLNACDSAPIYTSARRRIQGTSAVSATKKVSPDALAALVDKAEAEDKYEAHGVTWARRPQSFYAGELGVSLDTIGRYSAKPPFVKKVVSVEGGGTITLLRTGEAPASLTYDYAKRVMIRLWSAGQDKIDNPEGKWAVSPRGGQCLWGFAKDIHENIGDKLGLSAQSSAQLAIETFKYSIFNWAEVASAMKLAAETVPGYKPAFLNFVSLPHLCRFSEAAVYAYVQHLQFDHKKPPAALAFLEDPFVSGKILDLTDPLAGHPGLTPEIDKAIDTGWAAAEAKAAGAVS